MDVLRKTALVAGGFSLITFISSIPAVFLLDPVLNDPVLAVVTLRQDLAGAPGTDTASLVTRASRSSPSVIGRSPSAQASFRA